MCSRREYFDTIAGNRFIVELIYLIKYFKICRRIVRVCFGYRTNFHSLENCQQPMCDWRTESSVLSDVSPIFRGSLEFLLSIGKWKFYRPQIFIFIIVTLHMVCSINNDQVRREKKRELLWQWHSTKAFNKRVVNNISTWCMWWGEYESLSFICMNGFYGWEQLIFA